MPLQEAKSSRPGPRLVRFQPAGFSVSRFLKFINEIKQRGEQDRHQEADHDRPTKKQSVVPAVGGSHPGQEVKPMLIFVSLSAEHLIAVLALKVCHFDAACIARTIESCAQRIKSVPRLQSNKRCEFFS